MSQKCTERFKYLFYTNFSCKMKQTEILEVVLAFLAFVPLGASVLYARAHDRTTPPFELNVALFTVFIIVALGILFAERRGILKS
ncbi:MAG: hypothetical protein QW514_08170 [Thermoprotei archaeon]